MHLLQWNLPAFLTPGSLASFGSLQDAALMPTWYMVYGYMRAPDSPVSYPPPGHPSLWDPRGLVLPMSSASPIHFS